MPDDMAHGDAASGPAGITIGIIAYHPGPELRLCLLSLGGFSGRVIVWDNSETNCLDRFRDEFPGYTFINHGRNIGFGRAINQLFKLSVSPLVLILNSDVELQPATITTLHDFITKRPKTGLVTCACFNPAGLGSGPAGSRQPNTAMSYPGLGELILEKIMGWRTLKINLSGLPVISRLLNRRFQREHEAAWVGGACMLIRRVAWEAVSGFDEDFFLYSEEMEFQKRLTASGWGVEYTPDTGYVHHWGTSVAPVSDEVLLHVRISELIYGRRHFSPAAYRCLKKMVWLETWYKAWLLSLLGRTGRARKYRELRHLLAGDVSELVKRYYSDDTLRRLGIMNRS